MSTSNFLKGECQQCRGHIRFLDDALGSTTNCPHCGQPTELVANLVAPPAPRPRRWWLGVIIGVIIAVVFFAAGFASAIFWKNRPANAATAPEKNFQPAPADHSPARVAAPVGEIINHFSVSDIKLEKSPGNSLVYATGKIVNSANRRRFGVKVELELLDTNTNSLGKTKDYQAMLEPGAEWHFKAMVMKPKAVAVRVATILEDQ